MVSTFKNFRNYCWEGGRSSKGDHPIPRYLQDQISSASAALLLYQFYLLLIMGDRSKGKTKQDDPTWDHCVKVGDGKKLQCKHCNNSYWGGVFRIKNHLAQTRKDVAPCKNVPNQVRDIFKQILGESNKKEDDVVLCDGENERDLKKKMMLGGKTGMNTLNTLWKKGDRESVCKDICRFLYANALPFNLVKSPYFKTMLESVASFGPGFKLPSYHEARCTFLKKEVESIKMELLEKYKAEWKKTGCTLMSDGWSDGKSRSITNFLINSPRGTVFLKSVDTSGIIKNADNLFLLLDSVIEEIGEENVVQVVTDSASAYVKAGEMLMAKRNKLFWSPCAAHCLNLILCDIGDISIHKDTICKARKVTVYIYRHSWVLNLMRKHTKGRELIRPGATRFATSYLTLNSLEENKIGLRAMFGSEEWQRSNYSRKTEGERVMNIILADSEFWAAIKYCLKSVVPLVKVLRLVDGDAKPAMGYIFEAVDRAKDQIASNYNGIQKHYKPIWDIIDERWALQLHRPLHAAAYYLNPKFHYNPEFNAYYEIKRGLYETIQKMCPSPLERESIDKQLDLFHNAESMFGMDMAIQMRNKKQPALWWESFGGGCKELQNLAIRILSLTCSATGCERNWSTFDQVHSKRRNRLEQQRLSALVFVKYNLQLEARHKKRILENELYDPICLSDLESDDEWITEKEDPVLPVDNSWMNVSECFEVEEGESSKKRKRGPRDISYGYTEDLAYEENNNDEVQEDDEEYVRSEDLINNGDDNLFE